MVAQGKTTIALGSYIASMVDQSPHPIWSPKRQKVLGLYLDASMSQHLTFLAMVQDPSKGIAMFMQHHQQRYCEKKTSKKLLKNSKAWNKVINLIHHLLSK
jgi:hypothetical protein